MSTGNAHLFVHEKLNNSTFFIYFYREESFTWEIIPKLKERIFVETLQKTFAFTKKTLHKKENYLIEIFVFEIYEFLKSLELNISSNK